MLIRKNLDVPIPLKVGKVLDMENRFKYLDSWIEPDKIPDSEIKCWIEMARQEYM